MKKYLALAICSLLLFAGSLNAQQDKSKRASPPAKVTQTLEGGATVSIDYSQPSIKGRTIGQDIEPKKGQVWRMGANEATVFETDKDVEIEDQKLPAGKYSMFGLWEDDGFTLIFNKAWKIWGTNHDKDQDALRIKLKPDTQTKSVEQLTYTIDKDGKVKMNWGTMELEFKVKAK